MRVPRYRIGGLTGVSLRYCPWRSDHARQNDDLDVPCDRSGTGLIGLLCGTCSELRLLRLRLLRRSGVLWPRLLRPHLLWAVGRCLLLRRPLEWLGSRSPLALIAGEPARGTCAPCLGIAQVSGAS